MPDFAHIAKSFAIDPLAGLQLAIPLSFVLILPAQRIWWVHAPLAAILFIASLFTQDERHLAFDSFLVGLVAFAALCRDIPNQTLVYRVGILWFSAFALIAAVIYAAGDRVRHAMPIERVFVDRSFSAAATPKRET